MIIRNFILVSSLCLLASCTTSSTTTTSSSVVSSGSESSGAITIPTSSGSSRAPSGLMPGGGMGAPLDTSAAEKSYTGISYASDSATQKLDIYLPAGDGPHPVIIAIHGGGFISGSRNGSDLKGIFTGISRGYAIVTVDYRLSKEAVFPAAIDDIESAILWIKENGKEYNLDTEKIVLWGGSAGGNLSALAGTRGEKTKNTHVQVVVDWFGPVYFDRMDAEFAALGITPKMGTTSAATSAESKYLGKTVGTPEAEELVRAASPETYISSDDPAFYIQHGTADANIPLTQSENLAKKLTEVLGEDKVIFEKIEGAGHGGDQFHTTENLDKIFAFIEKHLQ